MRIGLCHRAADCPTGFSVVQMTSIDPDLVIQTPITPE